MVNLNLLCLYLKSCGQMIKEVWLIILTIKLYLKNLKNYNMVKHQSRKQCLENIL